MQFRLLLNIALLFSFIMPSCNSLVTAQDIQKSSNNWYFGNRAGLNFNTNPPSALTDGILNTQEGVAAISNRNGELLFYTDGSTVWDRSHKPMPNGNSTLDGHLSSTQSAIIIPDPGNASLYYVFTVDQLGGSNGLSYSIVNIDLPGNSNGLNSLGDVVAGRKNIQLATPVTEKITAVLKPDNNEYWLIAHEWNNNHFLAFEINCSGINESPVVSQIGNIHTGGNNNINSVGYIKASFDGNKLALANRRNSTVDLYDFDTNTGVVSNEVEIATNSTSLYGIEFTPDGEHIFIGSVNSLERYTLSSGAILDVAIDDLSPFTGNNAIRALQLGPDFNIYVSIRNLNYLSVIESPVGNTPTLITKAILLDPNSSGRRCRFGLPNIFLFEKNPLDTIEFSVCPGESIEFQGESYLAGSITSITMLDENDCTSRIILQVEELDAFVAERNESVCAGEIFTFDGVQIPAGSSQTFTLTSTNPSNCDTLLTIFVSEYESFNEELIFETCIGGTIEFNGTNIPADSTQTFTFEDRKGCDSTLMVIVIGNENLNIEEERNVSVCAGDTFTFDGVQILTGSSQTFTLTSTNPSNCDTTLTIFVSEYESFNEELIFETCINNSIEYNGVEIPANTEQTFTFEDRNGCDSTLIVIVIGIEIIETSISETICVGDTYLFNDIEYEAGTDTSFTFIGEDGCLNQISISIDQYPSVEIICEPIQEEYFIGELLNLSAEPSINGATYDWVNENGSNFSDSEAQSTVYTVTPSGQNLDIDSDLITLTVDINGCNSTTNKAIRIVRPMIQLPNLFTPGLGDNSVFSLGRLGVVNILNLEIYDRWGNKVYDNDNTQQEWDGNIDGKPAASDVYIYTVTYQLPGESPVTAFSDLTLLR